LSVKELQEKLNKYDSALVAKIGNNHKRLIRALQNAVDGHKMNQVNSSIYKPLYVVCTKPREKLYQDINARVDKMIRNG
jgi:tRNA A37 N6-isopentenylltransferase MiaA